MKDSPIPEEEKHPEEKKKKKAVSPRLPRIKQEKMKKSVIFGGFTPV
jgi:hypothetical protein